MNDRFFHDIAVTAMIQQHAERSNGVAVDDLPVARAASLLPRRKSEAFLRTRVRLINVSEKRSPGILAMDDSDPDGHGEWFQNSHV
jgi:hypothetical protein